MGKNILPPGTETFLSDKKGSQPVSALSAVYQNTMVDTAVKEYITRLGVDLGVPKPPVLFANDDLWRAIVKALAFEKRHTRLSVAKILELIVNPQISQVTVLNRTNYKNITVNSALTIPAGPNAGTYTVTEVLTHHLIFPGGTFPSIPESNVTYSVSGTTSTTGSIIALADGKHALVDFTLEFVNTHAQDYLTKVNSDIPQVGKVVFNKNSNSSSFSEKSFFYEFYDRARTGILKLELSSGVAPTTYQKWLPIRSTTLAAGSVSGALTVSLLSSTNFPTTAAPVQAVQATVDSVKILTPGVAGGPFLITSVSKHEITLGAPSFTVPGAPTTSEITYEIETAAGSGFLNGGRGHFLSKKGKILSTTRLFDPTVDFTQLLRPHVTGTTEPFLVTLNRGEANEETIEVVSRSGNTLNLVPNPNDSSGATSLLKYIHKKGETIEVYNRNTSTAGTYFPLSAAGATVSTATAGSNTTNLFDSANPFVALNASATYGDEVELVTVPAGSANKVGERRQIDNFTGAGQVRVTPAFNDSLLNCTYRIRKLYKAGLDNFIYVSDSSVFPAENFSIILNRGKDDEEVVWCGASSNNLTLNRLTVTNNDDDVAFVSKNHNFGITVEPAQLLIEGCNWEIIETRATGEYSVAIEPQCLPSPDLAGWFLHEKSPDWLMSASSGPAGAATQISVSGRFVGALHVPQCNPVANFSATDSQIMVSGDDFLRMFANKPDAHNTKSIHEVFRTIVIKSTVPSVTQESFIVTAGRTASLAKNVEVGKTTIFTHTPLLTGVGDNVYKLGAAGNVYPTNYTPGAPPTFSRVSTVTVTNSVLDAATNLYENTIAVGVTTNHFAGESLINNKTPLLLNRPIGFTCTTLGTCNITLLSNLPAYRYEDDITKTSESTFFANSALPVARNDYVVCSVGKFIPRNVIGKMLYITRSSNTTQGERRRIVSVGGPENNYIYVSPDFSAAVPVNATFCIEELLQSGDTESSSPVPLGDANSAFPGALNTVNLNLFNGGHRSVYPGSYVFSQPTDTIPVDQASSAVQFLRTGPDMTSAVTSAAAYKFPGPRRVIAPPTIPYSTATSLTAPLNYLLDINGLNPANPIWTAIAPGGNLVDDDSRIIGKFIQILDNERSDWRKVFKIRTYNSVTRTITVFTDFDSWIEVGTAYRILGDSSVPAVTPTSNYVWVDYPELFPDPSQGNFIITLGRGTIEESNINISTCVNTLGTDYGKFTVSVTENIPDNYFAGTLAELRVTKIALESGGTLPNTDGGFYCEYGYGETKVTDEENGVSNYLGNKMDPFYLGATQSHTKYKSDGITPVTLKGGLYNGPAVSLPVATASTISFQTLLSNPLGWYSQNILHAPLGQVTQFSVFGDNFIDKRFQDATLNGDLQIEVVPLASTTPVLLTLKIKDIHYGAANGCVITATPQLDLATYNAPGSGTVVRVKAQVRADDHESVLKEDAYVAIRQALLSSTITNRQFVNLEATATATPLNAIVCDDAAPISTALVGRAVKITDYGNDTPAAAGDVRTIVSISESVLNNGYDQINVDSNFGAAIAADTTFEIMPVEDPLYGAPRGNYAGTGGIYTPVSYPDGGMFLTPGYPISNSGNVRFPSGREYGVVQEYVKYLKRENNILTLSEPYYFKYDHPSGTKINLGSGVITTAGDGTDYRPYIFSSGYLDLLFSEIVGFKNLFTAAGIDCKTEETELGP